MPRISITQQDIDTGMPMSCSLCPAAIACSRAYGRPVTVNLTVRVWESDTAYVAFRSKSSVDPTLYAGQLTRFPLPRVLIDFIRAFDYNRRVSPIEFDLPDLPEEPCRPSA